jgi:hypothetical protein
VARAYPEDVYPKAKVILPRAFCLLPQYVFIESLAVDCVKCVGFAFVVDLVFIEVVTHQMIDLRL